MTSILSVVDVDGLVTSNISFDAMELLYMNRISSQGQMKNLTQVSSGIRNRHFSDLRLTTKGRAVYVKDSELDDISNLTFVNSTMYTLDIESSTVTSIDSINLTDNTYSARIILSTVGSLTNSLFSQCGGSARRVGGGLLIDRSNTTVSNSTFDTNTAVSGGAIGISCTVTSQCSNTIRDNTFIDNNATKGGAIYYSANRPMLENNTFTNNTAQYGPEVGSYPVKIVKKGSNNNKLTLSNVVSGLLYENDLEVELVDFDEQVMVLNSENTIKVTAPNPGTAILGTDFSKLEQGMAHFDSLIFKAEAGKQNVNFRLTSNAIDSSIISQVVGNDDGEYDNTITANFRYCKPGEIENASGQCQECAYGAYSLEWNATSCEQ